VANKVKGRVPWHTDGLTDGNYSHWRGGDKHNGTHKWALMNSVNSSKTKASLYTGQEEISMSGLIV